MLLTSHYMADITALCSRVLLIHQGALFHDGPLEQLAAQLAPCRQVRLELAQPASAEALTPYGAVVSELLACFEVLDLEVSDPPIEELIGGLFREQPTSAH